jgi:hypothetical protein
MHRAALLTIALSFCACERSDSTPYDASVDRPKSAPTDVTKPADAPGDVPADVASAPDVPLPPCGDGTPLGLARCVDGARYQADLETVAQPREPASAHWMSVQDLCATRLTELGFTVERHSYGTGVNVVGVRVGTAEPARRVVVGAHYDHIRNCAGADDNASGVAGALEVARVLARRSYPRTLVVALWDEEERGLIGSRAYAMRARSRAETIDAYFNFEMIGYVDRAPGSQRLPTGFGLIFAAAAREWEANAQRGDFLAAIADPRSSGAMGALEHYADRIGLPFIPLNLSDALLASPLVADLRRSDHASFWESGFPGVMLTDTSEFRYDRYHCRAGPDVVANLDRTFATQVVSATVAAAAESLGLPRE